MSITIITLAKRIPERIRSLMLNENLIYKAIPVAHDTHMIALFGIWQKYVMPNDTSLDISCSICLDKMLKDFREMQETLKELEKEKALLDI